MRLRFTRPALADLDGILDHISKDSPHAAARIHARIQAVIDLVASHHRVGGKTEDPAIRRVVAWPYPYLVFYEVKADEIVVHAVRHGAREPSGMPGVGEA